MKASFLGLSSCQIGSNINENTKGSHSTSMFQAQMKCNEIANLFPDKTLNKHRPLTLLAPQANEDVLCYHQTMKNDDGIQFKEGMDEEIDNFKQEKIFKLIPLKDRPDAKTLTPFAWSFKRKINPLGELTKHKARLCMHGAKQVKGPDY